MMAKSGGYLKLSSLEQLKGGNRGSCYRNNGTEENLWEA
jgi:hypothetical protein